MAHLKHSRRRKSTKGKSSSSKGSTKIKKFKKQGQYPRITKNWIRYRQEDPSKFIQKSFRNVPLSHTDYKGKIKAQRAIVGKLKTGKWKIQSILKKKT